MVLLLWIYLVRLNWVRKDVSFNIASPEQPVSGRPPSVFVALAVRVPGDEGGLGQVHGHRRLQCLPPLIGRQ